MTRLITQRSLAIKALLSTTGDSSTTVGSVGLATSKSSNIFDENAQFFLPKFSPKSHSFTCKYYSSITHKLANHPSRKLSPPKITFQKHSSVGVHSQAAVSECQNLLAMKPNDFAQFLRQKKISRFYAYYDPETQKVVVSHPEVQEIADWMLTSKDSHFKQHEALFMQLGIRTGCLMAAFIWRTNRGPACGGVRVQDYPTLEAYLQEGLRLSRVLGVKSALAGIWLGGGKGLISQPIDNLHVIPDFRQKMFYDFGDFVTSLNGCYIAGADRGANTGDLYMVHSRSRWSVCIPEDIGGAGNPAALLARGVICGMEAALDYLKLGDLNGKSVAVQGAGITGFEVTKILLDHGVAKVYVADINQKRLQDIEDTLRRQAAGRLHVQKIPLGGDDDTLFQQPCDILSPCAHGPVLSSKNIPFINAKIICGATNGQLSTDEDCKLLEDKGIVYVVEYIVNRMAVVNSACEYLGRLRNDPLIERHFNKTWEHSIYALTQRVLKEASEKGVTVLQAANELAEDFSLQDHPLFANRAKSIITDLVSSDWHQGKDFWRSRINFAVTKGFA